MLEYRIRRLPAAIEAARRQRASGRPVPVGVRPLRARRHAAVRPGPQRPSRAHPHRPARGAHRRPSAVGCLLLHGLDGRRRLRVRRRTATPGGDRPLLGAPASGCRRDGTAHIYGVIGPDEYHEPVDDNAFTNVAARWNLQACRGWRGRDGGRGRCDRRGDEALARASPMPWSTVTTPTRASTSSSRGSSGWSHSSSRRSRPAVRSPPISCWAPSVCAAPRS